MVISFLVIQLHSEAPEGFLGFAASLVGIDPKFSIGWF